MQDSYHIKQVCTRCKVLERQNKKLERQNRQLKEQQEINQATFLPFKPLAEVAQEQLQRALTENDKLRKLVPLMQEAVIQATGGISGAQSSLKKMNDMLVKGIAQKKAARTAQLSHFESIRDSVFSDTGIFVSEREPEGSEVYHKTFPETAESSCTSTNKQDKNHMKFNV